MDGIVEWVDAQRRVIDLVGGLDAQQAERRTGVPGLERPATCSRTWSVSGSMLAGDEPDDHNATWTQRQVDERRGRDLATLGRVAGVTEPMQAYMRERGTRPLGDLVIHEQDLRGALGVSGAQDTCGLAVIRDRMLAGSPRGSPGCRRSR